MDIVFHDLFTGSGQVSGRTPDTVGTDVWVAPVTIWSVASGYAVEGWGSYDVFGQVAHPSTDYKDAEVYVEYTVTTPGAVGWNNELAIWIRSDITESPPDYLVARNRLVLAFNYDGSCTWYLDNENTNILASGTLPHGIGTHNVRISMVDQDVSIYFNEVLAQSFTALVWPASVDGIQNIAGAWGVTTGWTSLTTEMKINEFRLSVPTPPVPFWTNYHGQSES